MQIPYIKTYTKEIKQYNSNVIARVMMQKDHCYLIFSYFAITDLFSTLALLSSFHYKLLTCNDRPCLTLVQMGVIRDFGLTLWTLCTRSGHKFNNVKDMCKYYNDWDYLIDLATSQLEWIEKSIIIINLLLMKKWMVQMVTTNLMSSMNMIFE